MVAACAKSAICCGSLTSTRCAVTFSRMGAVDLGGHRLQAGLVSIGHRDIAAARRQFQAASRPADATGSPRSRRRRIHGSAVIEFQLHVGKEFRLWVRLAGLAEKASGVSANPYTADRLWATARRAYSRRNQL